MWCVFFREMRKNRTILQRIPSANGPDSRKLSLVMIRKENLVSNEGDGSVAHSLMVVLQTFEMFHSHPGAVWLGGPYGSVTVGLLMMPL